MSHTAVETRRSTLLSSRLTGQEDRRTDSVTGRSLDVRRLSVTTLCCHRSPASPVEDRSSRLTSASPEYVVTGAVRRHYKSQSGVE